MTGVSPNPHPLDSHSFSCTATVYLGIEPPRSMHERATTWRSVKGRREPVRCPLVSWCVTDVLVAARF